MLLRPYASVTARPPEPGAVALAALPGSWPSLGCCKTAASQFVCTPCAYRNAFGITQLGAGESTSSLFADVALVEDDMETRKL